jgi:hypothetical protein
MRILKLAPLLAIVAGAVSSADAQNHPPPLPVCQAVKIVGGKGGAINLPGMPHRFHSASGSLTISNIGPLPAETLPIVATVNPFNGVHAGPFNKALHGSLAVLKMVYPPQAKTSVVTVFVGGNARSGNDLFIDTPGYTGPKAFISGTINLCVL